MGRIAEALKKARQERETQVQLGLADSPADRMSGSEPKTGTDSPAVDRDAVRTRIEPDQVSRPQAGLRGLGERISPHRRQAATFWGPFPTWDVPSSMVAVHERSSSIMEQYRATRTWLLRQGTTADRGCLAVTSSIQREGKSVTTANLAVTMAEIRHMKVLAIDADFRQGSLARLFNIPNVPGLADVLSGRATLDKGIVKTPLENLSVLPAGTCRGVSPTELLNSSAAARVFDGIRERYHFVLVDTPPVQKLSDVGVIGALCTGILMIVRMHKTPSNLVRQSVHWLQSNNLNVVGCVAVGCTPRDSRHMYRDPYEED
jgi:capsular exopolysaccharide synthesis family protein